jgi:L-glyceraldehyde 3-phosphate reductase
MTYIAANDRYDRLPYRRSGRSGLKLPAMRPVDTQRAILRRAFDLGVTHFHSAECRDFASRMGRRTL